MSRVTSFFFLATIFSVTFEKLHWNLAGAVNLADILALAFLAAWLAGHRRRVPFTTVVVLGFGAALLLVYLVGFYNLETQDALAQFAKGMVKFLIHFGFLAAGVAYLAAERPILASVPTDGAAAELIRQTGTGVVVPPDDPDAIRDALADMLGRWRSHELDGTALPAEVRDRVSRESRVRDLAELLWSLG